MSGSTKLSVEQAVDQIRRGEQIILVDDEDRENEGDLCMAAEMVTPEAINFMARFGRGLVCLTMTSERIRRLELPRMSERNESRFGTNFHVSIEARHGVTTGISAADRARTITAAVAAEATPQQLVSPGHVFPIRAVDGGVLVRCGQTEGSVDLARLAGLEPAGVICEIMKDDGTMARRPDLEAFAQNHGLGILTIADLIRYRLRCESMVEKVAETTVVPVGLQASFQLQVYRSAACQAQFVALVLGDVTRGQKVLVRVHRASLLNDVFAVAHGTGASKNHRSLALIEQAGAGVFIYVVPDDLALADQVMRFDKWQRFEGGVARDRLPELREFGLGAQILRSLGISRIRLMTDNPRRIAGLSGFGLEVCERVGIHG
jgi:3,4-dihydroxy 2-butanone 4-phosphate synthase/GTP cyclohydrolase II